MKRPINTLKNLLNTNPHQVEKNPKKSIFIVRALKKYDT